MELHQLRDFVAVAEALSFSQAAQKLHIAQPSLSKQIKNLEEELGVRLFDRANNRVSLTGEGRRFLVDAAKILALSVESVQAVRRAGRGETAQLKIGYTASLYCHLLPLTLDAFRNMVPFAAVNLFDMTCSQQLEAIDQGALDVGFVGVGDFLDGTVLQRECIAHYDMLVAVHRRNALAKKSTIAIDELHNVFFAALADHSHPGSQPRIERLCSEIGFTPRIVQVVNCEPAILSFVAAGLGVALLPEQAKVLPHNGIVFRPLKPPLQVDSWVAWKNSNRSEALKQYIEVLKHICEKTVARHT
jgi:DNA-binding transcriptional LysR family regulator